MSQKHHRTDCGPDQSTDPLTELTKTIYYKQGASWDEGLGVEPPAKFSTRPRAFYVPWFSSEIYINHLLTYIFIPCVQLSPLVQVSGHKYSFLQQNAKNTAFFTWKFKNFSLPRHYPQQAPYPQTTRLPALFCVNSCLTMISLGAACHPVIRLRITDCCLQFYDMYVNCYAILHSITERFVPLLLTYFYFLHCSHLTRIRLHISIFYHCTSQSILSSYLITATRRLQS